MVFNVPRLMVRFFAVAFSVLCLSTSSLAGEDEFRVTEWVDLLPQSDFDALSKPQEYVDEADDFSFEDKLSAEMSSAMASAFDDEYQAALTSTKVVDEFNGKKVKMAGYVVPLSYDDEMSVTEFFFVPYFGACLHLPPPPPNQIIHVTTDTAMSVYELYLPFWISGTLSTSLVKNNMATSAYSMKMSSFELYQEPPEVD